MKCVVNLNSDPLLNFVRESHGESYVCQSAPIAKLWDSKKLGFHVEVLEPKTFSCPYHLHHQEEELFLVLEGKAMVRQDEKFFEIAKGDLILFKTGVAHQFYNHSDLPFKFFALSNNVFDEVCEYPDSSKKWERKSKRLSQNGVEVDDYWKDEENPRAKWPSEIVGKIGP
jgi:uncharacterized cupin superfamily protein